MVFGLTLKSRKGKNHEGQNYENYGAEFLIDQLAVK